MAIFGTMSGILTADTSGWSKGLKKAGEDAKGFKATWEAQVKGIKGTFGRGSLFGETLEIAAGRGALRGVSEGIEQVKQMAEKAAEIHEQFEKGGASLRDMESAGLSVIPIFGQMYDAASEIREAITLEDQAEIDALNQQAQKNRELIAAAKLQLDLQKQLNSAVSSTTENFKELAEQQKAAAAGVGKSGLGKELFDAVGQANATIRGIDKTIADQFRENGTKVKSIYAAAAQQMQDAKRDLDAGWKKMLTSTDPYTVTEPVIAKLEAQYDASQQAFKDAKDNLDRFKAAAKAANDAAAPAKRAAEQLAIAKAMQAIIDKGNEYLQQQKSIGEAITENVMTPLEKLRQEYLQLQVLLRQGFISQQTAGRAAAQYLRDYQGSQEDHSDMNPTVQAEEVYGKKYARWMPKEGKASNKPVESIDKTAKDMLTALQTMAKNSGQEVVLSMP